MTDGAWIGMGLGALSTAGVIIAAIIKVHSPGSNSSAKGQCLAHSGLAADSESAKKDITELNEGQGKLWTAVDDLRKDMNTNTTTILKAIGDIKQ